MKPFSLSLEGKFASEGETKAHPRLRSMDVQSDVDGSTVGYLVVELAEVRLRQHARCGVEQSLLAVAPVHAIRHQPRLARRHVRVEEYYAAI